MDSVYWVLAASLLVWGGIFGYLVSTDNRVRRLERQRDADPASQRGSGEAQ